LPAPPPPASRMIVVSGSCSSITERQIAWALENGYDGIRVTPDDDERDLLRRAMKVLGAGLNPLLYTARGPADPAIRDARLEGERVGAQLGRITRRLLEESRLRRLVVAGGDTSGYVARQ